MQERLSILGRIVAVLAVTTIAVGPALAQTTSATKVAGTAGVPTTGQLKRTITDIPAEPNGLAQSPFGLLQVATADVIVPITNGQSAATIGQNLRDAINAQAPAGYSSVLTTPSGTANPARPKMARQNGSFSFTDTFTGVSGVTAAPSAFTVEDAPAISPGGLGFLVGALPALAYWTRRRINKKKRA
jgi:hypothetical protein